MNEGMWRPPLSVLLAPDCHIPPRSFLATSSSGLPDPVFLTSHIMAPKYNKTLSTLNTTQLLSAAGDFGLAVPVGARVPQLKALVKGYMDTHKALIRDPDYAPLFTKRERETYLARESLTPSVSSASSWHGIEPGDRQTASVSSRHSSPDPPADFAEPVDLERATQLQLLQSLDTVDLEKLIQGAFNPAQSSSLPLVDPTDAVRSALAAQKRPERQRGLLATNASYLVPDAIRKRFAAGLKTHVPLHYLTDAFCSHNNIASAKELDDLYALDGSRGVVSVAKELPIAPELALTFEEWHQAWSRLLELFQTYLPGEYEFWLAHYNRILHKPNKDKQWSVWVAYDSEIRRRSCTCALDPSLFHLDIWNEV
ncbi:hypothetical protein C8R43DRAFT_1175192, partial [Mycena crocata]